MSKTKIPITTLNFKELIGTPVLSTATDSILGSVADIAIEPEKNRIFAFLMMTHSIIPLSRIIPFSAVTGISKNHITVKSENSVSTLSSYKFPDNSALYKIETINKPLCRKSENMDSASAHSLGIIKNARFNIETGYIQEFIISKKKLPWSKNEKITVNKFRAVDNTIIID